MHLVQDFLSPLAQETLFTDDQWMAALLRFESGLAQAEADCGLIPPKAATAVARACAAVQIDPAAFSAHARHTGALGMAVVGPLRQWLLEHEPDMAPWLHWGTTTQDVVDTANSLVTQTALAALQTELDRLVAVLRNMATQHAATPMLARSLLQPAQVTSFGLKCAQTVAALVRSQHTLTALAPQALCVQLGGAVGNRACLGDRGAAVEQALAQQLGLSAPGHSWHTQRDSWLRLGLEVAVCSGTLAKLAQDWGLMAQYEVGELSEGSRGRTSSAMPHKRNPVQVLQALSQTAPVPHLAGLLLASMPQAHERALGEWQTEVVHWGLVWRHTHAAARALREAAEGLVVHTDRMRDHLDGLCGVVFSEALGHALTRWLGHTEALQAVENLAPTALARHFPLHTLLLDWVASTHGTDLRDRMAADVEAAADLQQAVRASEQACLALLTTHP